VSLYVEVKTDEAIPAFDWQKLLRSTSQVVRVNGREYRNRVGHSALNDAAEFLIANNFRYRRSHTAYKSSHNLFIITFFTNAIDKDYLFKNPGQYNISFAVADIPISLEVNVQEPNSDEKDVIAAISNIETLLFLTDPTNRRFANPKMIETIEQLLEVNTSYTKVLSLSLGLAKWNQPLNVTPDVADYNERQFQWLQEIEDLLGPYCTDEITCHIETAAVFRCALVFGMRAALEKNKDHSLQYYRRAVELYRKIVSSPLNGGYAQEAREYAESIQKTIQKLSRRP